MKLVLFLIFILLAFFINAYLNKQKKLMEPLENCEKKSDMVLKHKAETDKILEEIKKMNGLIKNVKKDINVNKGEINNNADMLIRAKNKINKQLEDC
tara:strand:+ start:400 stop:690 length:291 start_codon:yes stop_codon:yes gene_type:complete